MGIREWLRHYLGGENSTEEEKTVDARRRSNNVVVDVISNVMVTNVKVNAIYTHMPKGPRAPYTLFCKSVLDQFNFGGSSQKRENIHLYSGNHKVTLHF